MGACGYRIPGGALSCDSIVVLLKILWCIGAMGTLEAEKLTLRVELLSGPFLLLEMKVNPREEGLDQI